MSRDQKSETLAVEFEAVDDLGIQRAAERMLEKAKRGQKSLLLCGDVARDVVVDHLTAPRTLELENMAGGVTAQRVPPLMTPEQFDSCVHVVKNLEFAAKNLITGEPVPFLLEDKLCERLLAGVLGKEQYGLVLVDGPAKYFDLLVKQCAHLPIDFVRVKWDGEPGLRGRGDEAEEELFSPLSTWDIPPVEQIVDELLIVGGVHVFAGLFESYKSMAGLELSSAVLEGRKAFDRFQVSEKYAGTEIVWVNCDMSHGLFLSYAKNWGLDADDRFVSNSPRKAASFFVDSPALVKAVRSKILVVDTMLDLARIKDANQSAEWIEFFAKLRALMNEHGCLAIVLIAHPTKSGARSSVVDPSEYLKDSVTFGGKIDVGFGFRRVGEGEVHVERIKGRSFERPVKFSLATHDEDGESWISRGKFPAFGGGKSLSAKLKEPRKGPGAKLSDEAKALLAEASRRGLSSRKAADELKQKLGEGAPSDSTVFRWWKAMEQDPQEGLF